MIRRAVSVVSVHNAAVMRNARRGLTEPGPSCRVSADQPSRRYQTRAAAAGQSGSGVSGELAWHRAFDDSLPAAGIMRHAARRSLKDSPEPTRHRV